VNLLNIVYILYKRYADAVNAYPKTTIYIRIYGK